MYCDVFLMYFAYPNGLPSTILPPLPHSPPFYPSGQFSVSCSVVSTFPFSVSSRKNPSAQNYPPPFPTVLFDPKKREFFLKVIFLLCNGRESGK